MVKLLEQLNHDDLVKSCSSLCDKTLTIINVYDFHEHKRTLVYHTLRTREWYHYRIQYYNNC